MGGKSTMTYAGPESQINEPMTYIYIYIPVSIWDLINACTSTAKCDYGIKVLYS